MMKPVLLLLGAAFFLSSCDNDLDLTAEYKDITLVYGMMNTQEDTQWVRVQKAFLGDGDALLFATIPDSNYYPANAIQVVMRRKNTSGTILDSAVLPQTAYHKPKDDGIFFTTPNYLYPYTQPIVDNSIYEIVLRNLNSGKVVSAQTRIARPPLISYPPNSSTIINFEANSALPGANPSITFSWLKSDNVVAYQYAMIFHYEEFPTSNPSDITQKSFRVLSSVFNPFIDEPGANEIQYPVSKREFYNFVVANIAENPNLSRKFKKLDITVFAATKDFYDYFEINRPSTSIVQKTSDFTNVNNGLGLFTSRVFSTVPNINLHPNTLDSLRAGQFTNRLNFVN